jgi:peroxiredoxin
MNAPSMLEWLAEELPQRPLTAPVFFGGNGCLWCQDSLREFNGTFRRDLRAAGGEWFAVTAQYEAGAQDAQRSWNLDYQLLSDPSLVLANRFNIAVTPTQTTLAGMKEEYPHGMSQPGVVILDDAEKVQVHSAINRSEIDGGGTLDRPPPPVLWAALQAAQRGETVTLKGPRLDPEWLRSTTQTLTPSSRRGWLRSKSKNVALITGTSHGCSNPAIEHLESESHIPYQRVATTTRPPT